MKKIIAIIFILLIGLFIFGCSSTSEPETVEQGQESQTSKTPQNQQASGGGIPQPPTLPEG